MSYCGPDPNALFPLVWKNDRAKEVVDHESNSHLVSLIDDKSGLDFGHFQSRSGCSSTLATLGGGGDADGIVLFYDESKSWSSQVSGENATPFEYGRPRRVVVLPKVNTTIGFGGVGRNLVEFDLVWHCDRDTVDATLETRRNIPPSRRRTPRFLRTVEDVDTMAPTGRCTRVHTSGPRSLTMRWKELIKIGSGEFGVVWKGVGLDSGRLMAVKKLSNPPETSHEQWKATLNCEVKREVSFLSGLSHVSQKSHI